MNYILFDDNTWNELRPLTFTRPVCEMRVGILTIKEKWEKYLNARCSYLTKDYLQEKFTLTVTGDNTLINGSVIPTAELLSEIDTLQQGEVLKKGDIVCAVKLNRKQVEEFDFENTGNLKVVESVSELKRVAHLWDIFRMNGEAIEHDFKIITKGRKSQLLSKTNTVIGNNEVFVERGAVVECATINTKNGPVYIGKNTEIMERSAIRGPFALCEGSTVKMGAKIYGPTTVGPYSKVGGELNNVVLFAYSNKGHDGFLGNAVVGEWCNFGADTNNSNLKNNYSEVKMWNYTQNRFVKTGLQFCGLVMGDHSKCGINTMFNTGTLVGVGANIFGSGFPRNFIPSFAWGGSHGFSDTVIEKSFEVARLVMERRNIELTEIDEKILRHIFDITAKYREQFK
jgi:UDP-N-acetylglucosamine diphosphorylase/glucosamine-1-phosphate N-acetyltransferase